MKLRRLERHSEHAIAFSNKFNAHLVDEVEAAVQKHNIVVVGMKQNPLCSKARKALQAAGYDHVYLEYGSYLSRWRERLAIKLWSGWPLFPQVFVKGQLIGGCAETIKAIKSGEMKTLLEI